jgi:hypothetical protein
MMRCKTAMRASLAVLRLAAPPRQSGAYRHDAVLDCLTRDLLDMMQCWTAFGRASQSAWDAGSVSDIDELGIIFEKSQTWIVEEDCGEGEGT